MGETRDEDAVALRQQFERLHGAAGVLLAKATVTRQELDEARRLMDEAEAILHKVIAGWLASPVDPAETTH